MQNNFSPDKDSVKSLLKALKRLPDQVAYDLFNLNFVELYDHLDLEQWKEYTCAYTCELVKLLDSYNIHFIVRNNHVLCVINEYPIQLDLCFPEHYFTECESEILSAKKHFIKNNIFGNHGSLINVEEECECLKNN